MQLQSSTTTHQFATNDSDFEMTSLAAFKEINDRTLSYIDKFIDRSRLNAISETNLDPTLLPGFEQKKVGKVRDMYICKNYVVIVTTDRQSAFDRVLASVPFKGQVLNLSSQWWFSATRNLVPNHVIACPHPNITVGKRCTIFPVEFVMRGYITGTTSTSMWKNYEKGVRDYCGHILPEGLKKNQKLDGIKLTPTTKDDEHDELISAEQIIASGLMSAEDWTTCASYAHQLFANSQHIALSKGLILVDTKYEFGKDENGVVLLADEVQTPDSSRYWVAESYESRMTAGEVSEASCL